MRAGKHHGEPLIGDLGFSGRGGDDFIHNMQLIGCALDPIPMLPADAIDQLAPRDGEQPGLRVCGTASLRPASERSSKCLGESVLGRSHVLCARSEKRYQFSVTAARNLFCRIARLLVTVAIGHEGCLRDQCARTARKYAPTSAISAAPPPSRDWPRGSARPR